MNNNGKWIKQSNLYNMENFSIKRPQSRCVRVVIYNRKERDNVESKHLEERLKSLKKGSKAHTIVPSFIRLILGNLAVSIITIIDSGISSVYMPSCWTRGSPWNLSIPVPFSDANSSRASKLKTFNGKLSWKSRWFLYNESKKNKQTNKQTKRKKGIRSRFIINELWKCN